MSGSNLCPWDCRLTGVPAGGAPGRGEGARGGGVPAVMLGGVKGGGALGVSETPSTGTGTGSQRGCGDGAVVEARGWGGRDQERGGEGNGGCQACLHVCVPVHGVK